MKSKKVTIRTEVRWFNSDALKPKMQTRNAERHWVKHKTDKTGLGFVEFVMFTKNICTHPNPFYQRQNQLLWKGC